MRRNLRVVISCVTFETVKITDPIKFYKADKVYLLHMADRKIYKQFLDAVESTLKDIEIEYEKVYTTIYEFTPTLKELLKIIRTEKALGNHVYVNVEAGPQIYGAAAIVACMMEGGHPFFVGTKTFTIKEDKYFDGDTPIGLSREVYDPMEVPTFRLKRPKEHVVQAFRIWNEMRKNGKIMTDNLIINALEQNNLIGDIYDEGGRKISYKAKMGYRRKYLEKWISEGWIKKTDRGRYDITEFGEVAVEAFIQDD
jgi:predicted transcriptional regulator